MTYPKRIGPRAARVHLPGVGRGALEIVVMRRGDRATFWFRGELPRRANRVLREVLRRVAGVTAALPAFPAKVSQEDGNADLLVADAIDILRMRLQCDPDQAFDTLHDAAVRAGLSLEAQAAVVVDRALRSAELPTC